MRKERYANPERLVPCDGCSAAIRKPRRWCDRCVHVAPDIKALETILARYQLPPETRLDQAAAAIREQLREGTGNARDLADARARAQAQRADLSKRRCWWDLAQDLKPLVGRTATHNIASILFGDFPEEDRVGYLNAFAGTTYKDDGAEPRDLVARARAYLEARFAEDGFLAATDSPQRDAFMWPTIGETRPGSQERA